MPTGFHPNTHFFSAHLELAVELLRFLAVPQFPFVPFPRVRIDKRNLLEARVIVTTYNDHVRLLSPEPWLVSATKVYSGVGADIVMESLHSFDRVPRQIDGASWCNRLVSSTIGTLQQLRNIVPTPQCCSVGGCASQLVLRASPPVWPVYASYEC